MSVSLSENCTGCSACSTECPQKAISIKLDENGFYRSYIDKDKCVDCKLCEKVCPLIHPNYKNIADPTCYAFMAPDDIRMHSSSGGAFEVFASKIIDEGGAVFGVAYDDDFLTRMIFVETKDDLYKLRGSKYIMCDMGDIFHDVLTFLENGRLVLFSGTPCQIAGLKSYLDNKSYSGKIITIDLICHGIPSVKAFKAYVEDCHNHHKISYVGFKEKRYGWHASMTIDFEGADRYNMPCEKDSYFWSYLSGVNKNRSCGHCIFAKIPRQGDITIGDFWGISNYDMSMNDGKGTSVVLLNSSDGEEFWKSLNLNDCHIKEMPLESAVSGNLNLVESPKTHVSRNQFFKGLGKRRFDELAKWSYEGQRYDVGIVGIPVYVNFGGSLTYYALYNILEDLGYTTMLIGRPKSCGRPPILPEQVFEENPYPTHALKLQLKDKGEMKSLNDFCETFLVGSDQLFNADLYYRFGEIITLDWVNDNHKKIAYAASFGHSRFWGKETQRAEMSHYMKKFDYFSVREEDGVDVAKEYFDVDAKWVLDPIFLCEKKHLIELSERTLNKDDYRHIYAYILDPSEELNEIMKKSEDVLNLPIHLYSEMLYKPSEAQIAEEQIKFDYPLLQGKIEERLYSLIHSEFIVTNSFHGVCLAIIFHIPFVAVLNSNRGSSRFITILSKLCLINRLAMNLDDVERILHEPEIDFEQVESKLYELKKGSLDWLCFALENNKNKEFSSDDIYDRKLSRIYKELQLKDVKIQALLSEYELYKCFNLHDYLETLVRYRDKLQIIVSVKDTPGYSYLSDFDFFMRQLGLLESLVNKHWKSYIAVIDGTQVVCEKISTNEERVAYVGQINNKRLKVVSRSYRQGNIAAILIDDIDYSENQRGLNFVVVDKTSGAVIDTVAFDTHDEKIPCYRFGVLKYEKSKSANIIPNNGNKTVNIPRNENKIEAVNNYNVSFDNPIGKENSLLLHNMSSISAMGGSSMDYYIDKGYKEIVIYGTDMLIGLLSEQAYYSNISVRFYLSDIERDIDIRFPRVDKIRTTNIYKVLDKIIDVPILVASVGYPKELYQLKEKGVDVQKLGELNQYSHLKRMVLDPILQYKSKLDFLPCFLLDMPKSYEIKNASEIEKDMISGRKNPQKIKEQVFTTNGYDDEYYRQATAGIPIRKVGKFQFVDDISGKYVNASGGYRKTVPECKKYKRTIYAFGNSICYGLGSDDEHTIPSVIQRCINDSKYEGNYSVLNCANGGGLNSKAIIDSFYYHLPQNGDIVLVLMSDIPDIIIDQYKDQFHICDGKKILYRPHQLGEIFWDLNHVNAKGYTALGESIFEELENTGSLLSKDSIDLLNGYIPKDIAPMDLYLSKIQKNDLYKYIDYAKDEIGIQKGVIGSVVMNCNPFTLGHRYLIERAKEKCDYLIIFVVQENKSMFSFDDRLRLVKEGTKDIKNVCVIPSGNFIISKSTFNAYFGKEENQNARIDSSEDVLIFATIIAPALGISKRFAGEEPLDNVTNQYNQTMMRLFPKFGIEFCVINRNEVEEKPISASRVRTLLKQKKFSEIKALVPESTYNYLYTRFNNAKSVLVLGGTRFMGIRLVGELISHNHFVTIANRGTRADCFGKNVERIVYDRNDPSSIINSFSGAYYDVVIDTSAYDASSVRTLLSVLTCGRYIQVSSVAVYKQHHLNLLENECNTETEDYMLDKSGNYSIDKRNAECVALQEFKKYNPVIVRVPFVVEPDNLENKELNLRLFWYVDHIMNGKVMNVDNIEYCCSFVRTTDEARALTQLIESESFGILNYSSEGYVRVKDIISYIEAKTGKKAIIDAKGELHPFNGKHFENSGYSGCSLNLDKAKKLGCDVSELSDWIWHFLDYCIEQGKHEEVFD